MTSTSAFRFESSDLVLSDMMFALASCITPLYMERTKRLPRTRSEAAGCGEGLPEGFLSSRFALNACRSERGRKLFKKPLVTAARHPMKRSSRAWKKRGKMRWKWRKKRMRRRKREQKMRQR